MEVDLYETAIDAGKRMAGILIEEGHDSFGIRLSLAYFYKGILKLFDEYAPNQRPYALADLALATARAELKRRKEH